MRFEPYAPPCAQPEPTAPESLVVTEIRPATRGRRLLAAGIDAGLPVGGVFFTMTLLLLHRGSFLWPEFDGHVLMDRLIVGSIAGFLLAEGIHLCTRLAWGQTLGKRCLGLRVVDGKGRPVGAIRDLLLRRWLWLGVLMIPSLGVLILLADLLTILGEDRRCIHDLLARTHVIAVGRRAAS